MLLGQTLGLTERTPPNLKLVKAGWLEPALTLVERYLIRPGLGLSVRATCRCHAGGYLKVPCWCQDWLELPMQSYALAEGSRS